jgi:hypothetical protein
MKNIRFVLGLAALAACTAFAADAPLARFGWFGALAGSCWKAQHPDGKTSDTQCFEAQYGRYIRGTIKVYDGNALLVDSDSVFAMDAKTGHIAFTQWAANGNYGSGEITIEGPAILTFSPQPAAAGSKVQVRYQWIKTNADSFRAVREKRDGANWAEENAVVYSRVR